MMKLQTPTKQLLLDSPLVMGILNTTPDSFSDGGRYTQIERALQRALQMRDAGVAMIDIGGESTRPGAPEVSLEEELSRVIPVVKAIREHDKDIWISIDTSKAEVMQQAIDAGADIINDVRSLTQEGVLDVVAKAQVPVCIMHMQGQPKTMQDAPDYDDVVADVDGFLQQRIYECEQAGILRSNIIIDPGFGFGKTLAHNYQLLDKLEQFHQYNLPILAGMSRKSMIFKPLNKKPAECMVGSVACATLAASKGAHIIRVHDFEETIEAIEIVKLMKK
ncbi:dihydropteroate synthase [Vibrio palustris]|uniref:Dihydropteroate synthase n=1 Tax=Vibrio palustris TaxID=1918946 RepID=A0A1R4B8U3_9VIBR|nr:dihydropteroate synthase [Vibrio palustris]SJL85326.1 Dihydropteroate synthase [Vibrio palustris]